MGIFKKRNPKIQERSYTFVLSSGRCGTTHLSKVFKDPKLVVNHEQVYSRNTYKVLEKYLRPIAIKNDTSLAVEYVQDKKLPFINKLLSRSSSSIYFETGHLTNFGLFPALIMNIRNIKLIRLRRDRYETARSFMTRDEGNDIWNKSIDNPPYRWSHSPFDKISRLQVDPNIWERMSRFQRYLWAIDEVERQWIYLSRDYTFDYIEVNMEDFGSHGYDEIAEFVKSKPNLDAVNKKDNSSKNKGFIKPEFTLEYMRNEDLKYKALFNL